jgi:hypothetical protein
LVRAFPRRRLQLIPRRGRIRKGASVPYRIWPGIAYGSIAVMAKKTVVTEILVDDIDGSAGERTLNFTWEGTAYEIELSRRNAAAFEKTMKPYLDAARRVKSSRSRRGASGRSGKRDLGAIRDWATKNGFDVSARGRVAGSVIEAYDAAHD